ncbi:hypothetical protein DVH24_000176, partial [Malus domestica]
ESELKTPVRSKNTEVRTPNPVLSLLNGIGIFSYGVLGALYVLTWSEKKVTDAIVESSWLFLAEKDLELRDLKVTYNQRMDELTNALSDSQMLKDELLKNQKELELKNSPLDELNATEEYNNLKTSSCRKADLDAKLLGEREEKFQQLKEKLELALSDTSRNKELIADLTRENENLKELLDRELKIETNLKHEL